jgi:acetyl-CoA carboxylase carboxyl transferase subunit beta
MANWFKRFREGITTSTKEKKEAPDGMWCKCPRCQKARTVKEHRKNYYVCDNCDYHDRIGSVEYFNLLFDNNDYQPLFDDLEPEDFLNFTDLKSYKDRIKESQNKTGLKDAMRVGYGSVNGHQLVLPCMDFSFIGGSMGSVVGEKIALSIDHCIENRMPLMIIAKSGGARMMESAFSLMQMAKTSSKLTQLSEAQLPYISLLTDPTTGGVTASFAMLGDVNIAEPNALIGFAGPRVIKETIRRDLPEGFQRSEFLQEHGFIDYIAHRRHLKDNITEMLNYFEN